MAKGRRLSAPIRFGVIGTGGMGQGHCKTIGRIRDARVTAVCDIDASVAKEVGTRHKVPWFTGHRDLIRSGLCDAVIVATPHPVRPPIAIAAMRAGLHLLSEKPLSERVSTADRMIATAKETGVAFAVMFQRRTEPALAKAVTIVRNGELGKLHRITMVSPEYRSQAYYDSGGWRATWAGEGGGVMMNQSPHILDIFVQLGGRPSTVYGRTEIRQHDIEVEDLAEAMLTYPDGGTGYFYCSTLEAGPGQMIEVFGEKGKLLYRNGELRQYRFDTPIGTFTRENKSMWASPKCTEKKLRIGKRPSSGHREIIKNFVRHLLRGEALVTPGEDGMLSLELANAVWLSADRGAPVRIPLSRRGYDDFLKRKRAESTFVKKVRRIHRETDPQHVASKTRDAP